MGELATRRATVIALFLIGSGCAPSTPPPRPAVGCLGPQLAVYIARLVQESEDGTACVRLDFAIDGGGDDPRFPSEPAITGPLSFHGAFRVSRACEDVVIDDVLRDASVTPSGTVRGEVEATAVTLVRAVLEVDFDAAPDGSLPAQTIGISAADVDISERCPPAP